MNTLEQDINKAFKSLVSNYNIMIENCKVHFNKTGDTFWVKMIYKLEEKKQLAQSQIKSHDD